MSILDKGSLVITCCFLNVFMTVHFDCTDLKNGDEKQFTIKYSLFSEKLNVLGVDVKVTF